VLLGLRLRTKHRAGKVSNDGVVAVVDDMIKVSNKEQEEDAKMKKYCESGLEASAGTIAKLKEKLAALDAALDELRDSIKGTQDEIDQSLDVIKALDKSAAEATEQRKEDHEDYIETLTQTQAAIMLLNKAKNKLNKFYNPTMHKHEGEEDESLVQLRKRGRSFSGYRKSSASGGVIQLMDSIVADLKRDKTEAEMTEKEAHKDYVQLMNDMSATKKSDTEGVTDLKAAKADLVEKMEEVREQRSLADKEIQNEKMNIANLHGQCDSLLRDFEDRTEKRADDVDGLKNAKTLLSHE